MADTFKGIITADGKKRRLPYANVLEAPVSDKTLSEDGGFADAKVTGDNFAKAKAETDSLKGDLDNFCVNKYLSSDKWESGEWLPNGRPRASADTIRTRDCIPYDIIIGITPPNGYKILLVAYLDGTADGYVKNDGTHTQTSPGFQFSYGMIDNKYQYKIMLYNPKSSTITTSEGEGVAFKVSKNDVEIKKIENTKYSLEIIPIDSDHFKIKGYNKAHEKFIYHHFTHDLVNQTIDGNSVKTMDVWYADEIKDEDNNTIMQGNTNFIHNMSNSGHTGYVGAGDGCAVSEFTLFFADGMRIYPSELQRTLYCNDFRFITKVDHYLSSGNTKWTGVIPLLENGNPIIESVNDIDFVLTSDNEMHHRNRLTIKFNGAKFSECHGAMCAGFYPYFNNVIINNKEFSWNKINSDLSIEKIGATTLNLSTQGWVKADTVIMFGEKYRCTNRIVQCNPNRFGKANIRPWFPPNSDNRIKMYMMPVVCTISSENIADGDTVEVFNVGDVIDIDVYRKIDIT